MFLDYIKNVRNSQKHIYDDIKATNLPVVIYGAGDTALQAAKNLRQHGIEPVAYAVDHEYYSPKLFDGVPIWDFSLLKKHPKKFAVILAIGAGTVVKSFLNDQSMTKFTFPDVFGKIAPISYDFIVANQKAFQETYDCLADDFSRKVMLAYLNLKVSGDIAYNIDVCNSGTEYFDEEIIGPCKNMAIFVDCGAYRGDTIESFINWSRGAYSQIYAMETDLNNIAALKLSTDVHGWENVEIVPKATWDKIEPLYFNLEGVYGASVSTNNGQFQVEGCPIDNVLNGLRVDFIKMDIEGAELNGLHGAEESIRRYHPCLAICAYHRTEDLITLPQYINSLGGYNLYLRKYGMVHEYDLVLYAVPKGK